MVRIMQKGRIEWYDSEWVTMVVSLSLWMMAQLRSVRQEAASHAEVRGAAHSQERKQLVQRP